MINLPELHTPPDDIGDGLVPSAPQAAASCAAARYATTPAHGAHGWPLAAATTDAACCSHNWCVARQFGSGAHQYRKARRQPM
jgi:hypothetical protein